MNLKDWGKEPLPRLGDNPPSCEELKEAIEYQLNKLIESGEIMAKSGVSDIEVEVTPVEGADKRLGRVNIRIRPKSYEAYCFLLQAGLFDE